MAVELAKTIMESVLKFMRTHSPPPDEDAVIAVGIVEAISVIASSNNNKDSFLEGMVSLLSERAKWRGVQ